MEKRPCGDHFVEFEKPISMMRYTFDCYFYQHHQQLSRFRPNVTKIHKMRWLFLKGDRSLLVEYLLPTEVEDTIMISGLIMVMDTTNFEIEVLYHWQQPFKLNYAPILDKSSVKLSFVCR